MAWIDINKELPEIGKKVRLSYGLGGTRAAVCDDWVSEGWITKGGNWSVKYKEGMPKYPVPTHWQTITKT